MENHAQSSLRSPNFLTNGLGMGGIVFSILALNVAGRLHLGVRGVFILAILFIFVGFTTFYWLSASLQYLAGIMQRNPATAQGNITIMNGLWPLILLGPATSLQRWLPLPGSIFTLLILCTTLATVTEETRRIYRMNLLQTVFSLITTFCLALLAATGIFVWPLMFFLGIGQSI
jgi:hypothetical protein